MPKGYLKVQRLPGGTPLAMVIDIDGFIIVVDAAATPTTTWTGKLVKNSINISIAGSSNSSISGFSIIGCKVHTN